MAKQQMKNTAWVSIPNFLLCCFSALLLCGCSNPLTSADSDYGTRPARDRLRAIDRLDRDKYALPAPEAPPPPTVGEKYTSRFASAPTAEMRLEDARAAVLENNLDLRVVLVDPLIQTEGLRAEEAKFEAVFKPFASFQNIDQPTLDTTTANQQKLTTFGGEVDVPLRSGGRASVNFSENRSRTNNPFFTANSAYQSALAFSLSQPLLRGAGRRANTYSIRIAAYNRDLAEAATKLEIIRQIANADRAYWRLYAASKTLEVRQKQYEVGLAQLESAKRRVNAGDAAELEITRAQSGAASQLEQIILAEKDLLDQQRELKRLLNIKGLEIDSRTRIIAVTPPDPVRYQFDGPALASVGVANRMEMLELELQLAQDYSTIEFNKNQALPLFTLDFQYSIPGLGTDLGASVDQLAARNFRTWSASLRGEIPIGNEAAKARVQSAILTRLQRLSTKEARALSIKAEVLGAVDALDAAWQRILAARQSVILAARTLEGERHQFDAGARTSTDVLDAAARLANEQTSEITALADYQIAQVDLAFATGTLLGDDKIEWSPRDPRTGKPGSGDPTPFAFPPYETPEGKPGPANPRTGPTPAMHE
ncbi:MAG TPA: TolC family protein [Phycisphaerales bacterium]|nr:TolC family protein [Phycisphaerales bacterium]